MLSHLSIKNFVIIDELELKFDQGLNIFTGETGAGKSILIDAISGILGDKMNTGQIRSGYEQATIEGTFDISRLTNLRELLKTHEIKVDNNTITLRREIFASGRGRCFAGNQQIPVSRLKEIGEHLIDIHGQNEHQTITRAAKHRELLDSFAGTLDQVEKVRELHARLHDIRERLESHSFDEREKARRIEFNSFAVKEIAAADLKPGEEDELKQESTLLSNAEKLFQEINEAAANFNGDTGIIQKLKKTEKSLSSVAQYDPDIIPMLEEVREALYSLEDTGMFLRDYEKNLDYSPSRINQVEERLALISTLKKKYGDSIEEILAYAERAQKEIDAISSSDEEIERLQEEQKQTSQEVKEAALKLSEKRQEMAQVLEEKVMEQLKDLAMEGTTFRVSIMQEEDPEGDVEAHNTRYLLYPHGLDRIEFLIAANRGEKLQQLRKVASGGEMSRIMLALKNVLLEQDIVETLIFDEVDSGIGGKTADTVGRKLKSLSNKSQLLLITHLPQIAAMSDSHFVVSKNETRDRTTTTVKNLGTSEKVREIARMIAGEEITQKSLEHAEELINLAGSKQA